MKLLAVIILFYCIAPGVSGQNHFAAERMYVKFLLPKQLLLQALLLTSILIIKMMKKRLQPFIHGLPANIKYDADSIHYVILDDDNEERVRWALRRRRGVCENFAAIFTDVANQSGIGSFAVQGFTKQGGSLDRAPHVWCVAYVDRKWRLY